jgi:hypothetical protein
MLTQGIFRTVVVFVIAALFAAIVPAKLAAQVLYGSVTGTVTDETGAVVPAARLAVVNEETALRREVETDAAGIYRIVDLPQGSTPSKPPPRDSVP